MTWNKNTEESQRRLLIEALAAGLFSTALGSRNVGAQLLGSRPAPLPEGKSIYRIEGQVLVDGQPATPDTRIAANSTIVTGKDGEVIYAVGEPAHLQRSESQVTMETKEANSVVVAGLRVLTGKILSVFPSGRPVRMTTRNASIGIRGTGVYMESDPEQTYFCTCYGTADIASASDPTSRETVVSSHHDRPLYVLTGEQPGRNIRLAPFINHTDQELMLIEALVGRTPPFVFPKDNYTRPRRRTY
jgi:hypothetical protein